MNAFFPEIKKNFGFGMMRLPMVGELVDMEQSKQMVDRFMEAGFNYFDTAHLYIQGQSEQAIKECVSSRYPRESFVLANKLSASCFNKEEEIRPLVEEQLKACGVTYFDFFLMHAVGAERHELYSKTHAYDIAQELKREGKVRHVGFSFHDTPELLERILMERPEMEFVQLQFNYVDYEDLHVQSKACYEICRKHNKPVMVMEPVKGGSLVNLPQEAMPLFKTGSPASYAIRYAAGFEGVCMVLSGMSTPEQVEDNLSFMQDFQPLTAEEHDAVARVRTLFQAQHRIPCTACRYCTDGCPVSIPIPEIFAAVNQQNGKNPPPIDGELIGRGRECISCGQCEGACPQRLQIRKLLEEVCDRFR